MRPYEPPRHILLRRHTEAITDKDLAFLEKALTVQLRECAEAYGLPAPGVSLVTPDTHLPTGEALGIDFVDDDGKPGSVGHHGWSDLASFPWALVGVKEHPHWEMVASHEALEALVNLRLGRWAEDETGMDWSMEVCDPVEDTGYYIEVAMFGETRHIGVSNYVLPAFWEYFAAAGPFDLIGVLNGPFSLSPGGYAVVRRDGATLALAGSRSARSSTPTKRATSRVRALLGRRP